MWEDNLGFYKGLDIQLEGKFWRKINDCPLRMTQSMTQFHKFKKKSFGHLFLILDSHIWQQKVFFSHNLGP
jgi:hypothetical protein